MVLFWQEFRFHPINYNLVSLYCIFNAVNENPARMKNLTIRKKTSIHLHLNSKKVYFAALVSIFDYIVEIILIH
jgi:hypothetical protein